MTKIDHTFSKMTLIMDSRSTYTAQPDILCKLACSSISTARPATFEELWHMMTVHLPFQPSANPVAAPAMPPLSAAGQAALQHFPPFLVGVGTVDMPGANISACKRLPSLTVLLLPHSLRDAAHK